MEKQLLFQGEAPDTTAAVVPAATVTGITVEPQWLVLVRALSKWVLWATVFVSALMGMEVDLGVGRVLGGAIMGLLGFAFVSLGDGILSLLWLLLRWLLPALHLVRWARWLALVPAAVPGRLLGVFLYTAGDMLWPNSFLQHVRVAPVGELFIILMGMTGVLVALLRMAWPSPQGRMLLAAAVALNAAYLFWVFQPGVDGYLPQMPQDTLMAMPTVANPGTSGPYAVQALSYGSGEDLHRPEFAAEAALTTPAVDGSEHFAGYSGLGGRYFKWYWGFDFTALPLNGLVWYPQGEGPFPIVLMVHGNHVMTAPSDRGYAYLGEHLASHGYIAVSVDENFLNGVMFLDGNMEEMPLRAWLLLKHLQVWREWNETEGNPFFGIVDLERVALIGHSRGGEAVAVAAEMNWDTPAQSGTPTGEDVFGFGIRSVASIAPSDGNYKLHGRTVTLAHSDYLLLGGGHDADTYALYAQAQYNRKVFDENAAGFKALAYVYRANHGQFNTVWGDQDRGWLNSLLLNRKPLLSAAEQEEVAQVVITSYLEASLKGQEGYRALFANPGAAQEWIPGILFVTQYQAADFVALEAEPANVSGAVDARRQALLLRDGASRQQNWALRLSWNGEASAVVEMAVERAGALHGQDAVTLSLVSADETSRPVDVRVELVLHNGQIARLSLDDIAPVYPPLPAKLLKGDWLGPLPGYQITLKSPIERVLQTYTTPLTAFEGVDDATGIEDVQLVRVLVGGASGGAIYLDALGFTAAP